MNKIPKSLRLWFLIHFIIDIILAIPLIFFPRFFLNILHWPNIDIFSARLVGAALVAIGSVSFLRNNKGLETYKTMLLLKVIWSFSALIVIFITMQEDFPIIGWLFFIIFLIFFVIWVYYIKKLKY